MASFWETAALVEFVKAGLSQPPAPPGCCSGGITMEMLLDPAHEIWVDCLWIIVLACRNAEKLPGWLRRAHSGLLRMLMVIFGPLMSTTSCCVMV